MKVTSKRKLLFILNPVAGNGKARALHQPILDFLSNSDHHIEIRLTEKKGDALKFSEEAAKNGIDTVIAVGGDGTVNEVATGLINSNCNIGILPVGSGNGLARHYKIPFSTELALNVILKNRFIKHDAVRINNFYSFNVSGVGFDAHIAHLFDKSSVRGLTGYTKLVIREYFKYQPTQITVEGFHNQSIVSPLLIAIANTSQFGNNAFIAPSADANDGKVDLTIMNKLTMINIVPTLWKLFNKKLKPSENVMMLQNDAFKLSCFTLMPLHVDGEPAGFHNKLNVEVIRGAVNIIIP